MFLFVDGLALKQIMCWSGVALLGAMTAAVKLGRRLCRTALVKNSDARRTMLLTTRAEGRASKSPSAASVTSVKDAMLVPGHPRRI